MTTFLLQSALELASFDLKVLPVHSVDADGRCSCGCRKSNCGSRGKHPRIRDWHNLASSDEQTICAWWEKWPTANVGIQWGPRSNAIDIEFDDEEGRASADRYLGGIVTPSYRSGRSTHRIFRYTNEFAGLGASKKGEKVEHLEFRIGADGRGAQSVAPPSRHYSGRLYSWLLGLSITDVEIAAPPSALIELLLRWSSGANGGDHKRQTAAPLSDRIPRGQRHVALVSLAGTMRRRGLVKDEILPSLRAVAERRCQYVSGDEIDVEAIAESVCRYDASDSILTNTPQLATAARKEALTGLHPAIRRAHVHAIVHRWKARRPKQ
jgi:hypothetical protein